MKANAQHLRISPKKLNVIAHLVRGRGAIEASNLLTGVPKKGADMLKKVLDSAIANAKHNDATAPDNLVISQVYVTKASVLRRGVPASRGRVAPIKKRNSHLFIELAEPMATPTKASKPVKKTEPKKTATKKPAAKKPAAKKTASKSTK